MRTAILLLVCAGCYVPPAAYEASDAGSKPIPSECGNPGVIEACARALPNLRECCTSGVGDWVAPDAGSLCADLEARADDPASFCPWIQHARCPAVHSAGVCQ